ncbi:MAG TPA: hypothetical protein VF677_06885 [Flavobacterium sp.]|jgi:hypothetical protein
MNLLERIFRKPHLKWPRCLGKGKVDWEDIRRLNKQLKWQLDKCAYCNGHGKVTAETFSEISFDNTYLTIDLTTCEKNKLKNGDIETVEKAKMHEKFLNNLINYIEHKFLVEHLDVESIADLYLSTEHKSKIFSIKRNDLISYIKKVIDIKKSKMN